MMNPRPFQTSVALAVVAGAALSLLTPNAGLTALAVVALGVIVIFLTREGEPPILLFVVGVQWLQGATKVLHADGLGVDIEQLSLYGGKVELAVALTVIATMSLSVGAFLALRSAPASDPDAAMAEAREFSIERFWWAYLAALAFYSGIVAVAWVSPQFAQIAIALASLKIMVIAAFAFVVCARQSGFLLLACACLIELVIGLSGFFGEFKTVIFILLIVFYAGLRERPYLRFAAMASLFAFVIGMSVVWTAVKGEYRDFISAGSGEQAVALPWSERMEVLGESVANLTMDELVEGANDLAQRVAYVDYFAAALANVPHQVAHTDGALIGASLLHVLRPRLLFPDKEALFDNDNVIEYAGVRVAESGSGTSIGLGYLGELYVDLGIFGMLAAVFVVGWLAGKIYAVILSSRRLPRFVNYGLALTVLLPLAFGETSLVKLVGAITMLFLVTIAVREVALRYLVVEHLRIPGGLAPLRMTRAALAGRR